MALNGSGRAPAGLDAGALREAGHAAIPVGSAHAVTIPGAVDAFVPAPADWGRLGLAASSPPRSAMPRRACRSRRASPSTGRSAPRRSRARRAATSSPTARAPRRAGSSARPLRPRSCAVSPATARRASTRARSPRTWSAALRALGGTHTADDFAAVEATWVEPVAGDYRGAELLEHPPNGQGATAILLARILVAFRPRGDGPVRRRPRASRARGDQARLRRARPFRRRSRAAPRASPTCSTRRTADAAGGADRPGRGPARTRPRPTEAVHRDTVYITVVDRDRMAVSLIYSIFHAFGSGLASSRFGINFQNRGAGFTLARGTRTRPRAASGRCTPSSRRCSAARGAGRCRSGSWAAHTRPTGHARFVSNLVDFGMDPQEAIDAPRCFAEGRPRSSRAAIPTRSAPNSPALGHRVESRTSRSAARRRS